MTPDDVMAWSGAGLFAAICAGGMVTCASIIVWLLIWTLEQVRTWLAKWW